MPFSWAGIDPAQTVSVRAADADFPSGVAGNYLAGHYAQRVQDWTKASDYLTQTLKVDPNNPELLRRAMVLAMGAGQVEKAIAMARRVSAEDPDAGALSALFLTLDDFAHHDYAKARARLLSIPPDGGMSEFVVPLLGGWASAGEGRFEQNSRPVNPVQIYHSVLIVDFLGRADKVQGLLEKPEAVAGLPVGHLETLADICLKAGLKDRARELYRDALTLLPGDPGILEKISGIEKKVPSPAPSVASVERGAALAFLDMAGLLASEYSDDSARIFLCMALFLDPALRDAHDLLIRLDARNGRYDEAIALFSKTAGKERQKPQEARFLAELLEEAGRPEQALSVLGKFSASDVDSLIQSADIYRRSERYNDALKAYNKVFSLYKSGKEPPGWSLYYARGMVLERLGQWGQAEPDLEKALSLAPEHPYILNYLGYGWADRGEHIDRALDMLRKAAALRPSDGYITDSLGWALYRAGRYEESVDSMEKAVALVPYDALINDHLGDVYWKIGRKREAKFQWQRARNFNDDPKLSASLEEKILKGLEEREDIHKASH